MNIPLLGSLAYLVALVGADVLLLFGLHGGMAGAGYGASLAQWAGAATQLVLLHRKGVSARRCWAAGPWGGACREEGSGAGSWAGLAPLWMGPACARLLRC